MNSCGTRPSSSHSVCIHKENGHHRQSKTIWIHKENGHHRQQAYEFIFGSILLPSLRGQLGRVQGHRQCADAWGRASDSCSCHVRYPRWRWPPLRVSKLYISKTHLFRLLRFLNLRCCYDFMGVPLYDSVCCDSCVYHYIWFSMSTHKYI